jgi:hypothetical protein
MVQSIGAQIGLLAFAAAILAGLLAGNSPSGILFRALLAMLGGATVGQLASWTAKLVLRDYLQRRKLEVDRAHIEAMRALPGTRGPEPPLANDTYEAN